MIEQKNTGLADMLSSGDPAQVAEACDDVADSYQTEFQLSDEVVAAVKKLRSPGKKAAKLAGAMRRWVLPGQQQRRRCRFAEPHARQ